MIFENNNRFLYLPKKNPKLFMLGLLNNKFHKYVTVSNDRSIVRKLVDPHPLKHISIQPFWPL